MGSRTDGNPKLPLAVRGVAWVQRRDRLCAEGSAKSEGPVASAAMRGEMGLVLVVHMPGRAACHRSGNRVVMCVMTGDATDNSASDAAFSGRRRSREQSGGYRQCKRYTSETHGPPPDLALNVERGFGSSGPIKSPQCSQEVFPGVSI